MFEIFKKRIQLEGLTEHLKKKINKAYALDQLTDEEYTELLAMGR